MAISKKQSDIVSGVSFSLSEAGIRRKDAVLIGVSGGVDSIVLASILSKLQRSGAFKTLGIAHLNHHLRGKASDSDASFVKKFAEKWGAEYYEGSAEVRSVAMREKIGTEEAARMLRYDFFLSCAKQNEYRWVATAHTADDQLETIIMNIVRGSGIRGMRGIPKTRTLISPIRLIRPILDYSREQIIAYAKKEKLKWREDHTNKSDVYTRNRIRSKVIPGLKESFIDKNIYTGVNTLTKNMEAAAAFIDDSVVELRKQAKVPTKEFFILPTYSQFRIAVLKNTNSLLTRELFTSEIESLLGNYFSFDSSNWHRVLQLLSGKNSNTLQLSKEVLISVDGKLIQIETLPNPERVRQLLGFGDPVDTIIGLIQSAPAKASKVSKDKNIAYIPRSFVDTHGLLVRNWMPADRIRPFGMKGTRAVSDLLSEAGVKSERNKQNFPIVVAADAPDRILWIPGIRASELCRVTEGETACKLQRTIR